MRIVLAVVAALVAGTAYAVEPGSITRFETARVEAKANLETPSGKAYDKAIAKYFEGHMAPVLSQCFETTPKPDASSFEMVFVLSGEGKPRDILVWPETNIATCFTAQLRTASLPAPPREGFLAYMEMRIAP